jgi:ABC-type transport system involved in multi-copper enzyme maturation permease subunit
MFAALPIEQELFGLKDLLSGFMSWIESAGSYATVGLLLWFIIGLTMMKRKERARIPSWVSMSFVVASAMAFGLYGIYVAALLIKPPPPPQFTVDGVMIARKGILWHDWIGFLGGCFAFYAVLLPVVRSLWSLSPRRIYALAKLSFKDAIRRRFLWAISGIMVLVFLLAPWFIHNNPQYQISSYIGVVEWVMACLLLLSAFILASFSIPTDIKQQTIHTVLTKPVERFEIVLGRFLGYSALMTLVLIAMTGISLLYVVWEADPDAAAESLKARDPLWGDLRFEGTGKEQEGINVGREWSYRSYISGPMPGQPTHTAVWQFASVPPSLGNRQTVRCEYTFDIFKSTKGYEARGISCGFQFRSWHYHAGNEIPYRKELQEHPDQRNEISEKYGYYEVPATAVSSGHTYSLDLPAGLFKSIASGPDEQARQEAEITKKPLPALEVRVQCLHPTQYVGMAKHDFWLRQDDPNSGNDKLWFAYNFFKAQAVGLWLKLLIVIGISVGLSTYLSGVISLLVGLVLYGCGIILPFIQEVAFGKNYGGGTFQAAYTLFSRKVPGQELGESVPVKAILASDEFVRFGFRFVLDLFPDVSRFDFTRFVEAGFNIPESQILISFLLMAAYVLPWLVLAFYLMKWKEVASAT